MPLATRTCSEVLSQAEANRRRVLATLSDHEDQEKALREADQMVEDARNRHDCI